MERIEIFFVYIRLNLIIVMVDGQRQNNTLLKHKSTRVHTAKHKEKVKELGTLPIDYSLLLLWKRGRGSKHYPPAVGTALNCVPFNFICLSWSVFFFGLSFIIIAHSSSWRVETKEYTLCFIAFQATKFKNLVWKYPKSGFNKPMDKILFFILQFYFFFFLNL